MKKLILLIGVAILTSSSTVHVSVNSYQEVFVCDSKNGKKYHFKKGCRGLNACKATIIKLNIEAAKRRGKTICGWED